MKRTTSTLPTGRVAFLRIFTIGLTLIVIARFFVVAVVDHEKALAKAKSQYGIKQSIDAKRGKIFLSSLNGENDFPIALNADSYTVVVDPLVIKDSAAAAAALVPLLQLPAEEITAKISNQKKRYVILKKQLDREQADEVEKLNLKGVYLENNPRRFYPETYLAAQTIGFVNSEGKGIGGIEGFFNEDLKGYDGTLIGEKDAQNQLISFGKSTNAKNGTDIVLTIDHSLQFMTETKLREALKKYDAEGGSIVVMDVKTGAILALANEPGFDLNKYNEVPSDKQSIFRNRAVADTWEPGSIFKAFTMAAGLDLGLYEPDTKAELGCRIKVNGFDIGNAEDKCYPNPSVTQILADSINIGTIWAADKIGNDNFGRYISNFGFGAKTGLELQPEGQGSFGKPAKWRDVTRATISFGQGISVTPIQIVSGYAALANDGKLMKPYLVAKRIEADGRSLISQPKEVRQVIKPETASKITMMLEAVVTDGHGKRAAVPGYKVAGKTGTAQVVGDDGKYAENQHIGSFAGFFPSDNPKFAMVVKLDKPKAVEFAESSAAPTFGELAKWLLHYAKVSPNQPVSEPTKQPIEPASASPTPAILPVAN